MKSLVPVHILLATYNGARHLASQLASIAGQSHAHWTLTVSDDGSSDGTLDLVHDFARRVAQPVTVLQGPAQGSSTLNFLHLLAQANGRDPHALHAFCDQDDVWLEDKLARAVQWHQTQAQAHPHAAARLYASRTHFVNEQLEPQGLSPALGCAPSFGHALVQNMASGNTMLLNQPVLLALQQVQPAHSIWHDWTCYLVATALGARVVMDDRPSVLYRQHGANVIGANDGWGDRLRRVRPLLQGRFRHWTQTNIAAVHDIAHLASPASLALLQQFEALRREPSAARRLSAWRKTPIRRQSPGSNLSLALGLALGLV